MDFLKNKQGFCPQQHLLWGFSAIVKALVQTNLFWLLEASQKRISCEASPTKETGQLKNIAPAMKSDTRTFVPLSCCYWSFLFVPSFSYEVFVSVSLFFAFLPDASTVRILEVSQLNFSGDTGRLGLERVIPWFLRNGHTGISGVPTTDSRLCFSTFCFLKFAERIWRFPPLTLQTAIPTNLMVETILVIFSVHVLEFSLIVAQPRACPKCHRLPAVALAN